MKKGIIMEINERFLTLLTPEGEFLRARKFNSHYQIGQEIDFFPVAVEEGKKPSFLNYFQNLKGKVIFVVALLMILTIASVLPFYGKNEVYAYMSIDVNPSIELGVNEKFQVIEIFAYNEAGQKIIANINNWRKKNIHVLTNEILQEIKVQGYMKTSQEIVIATVYANEGFQDQDKRWEEEIAEIKTVINDENLQLKVVEGSKTDRDQAKEMGLTTGLYKQEQLKDSIPHTRDNEEPGTKEQSNNDFNKAKVDNNQMKNSPYPLGPQKKDRDSEGTNGKGKENKRDQKKEYPPGLGKKKADNEKELSPLENHNVKKAEKNSQKEKYNHNQNRKEKNNKEKNNNERHPHKGNQNVKQNDHAKQNHNAQQRSKEKQDHNAQQRSKENQNHNAQQRSKEKQNHKEKYNNDKRNDKKDHN